MNPIEKKILKSANRCVWSSLPASFEIEAFKTCKKEIRAIVGKPGVIFAGCKDFASLLEKAAKLKGYES